MESPSNNRLKGVIPGLLLFSFLCFLLASCYRLVSWDARSPEAVQGTIDLTNWLPERDGPVIMEGEWEFYSGQLLTPRDFEGPEEPAGKGFITVPGEWNGYRAGDKSLTGNGYATYRLWLKGAGQEIRAGIKMPAANTAYKLWINGDLLASNGIVGTNLRAMSPQQKPDAIYFDTEQGDVELVIQVSNFMHRKGGLLKSPIYGTQEQIKSERDWGLSLGMFLCGSLAIMGLYNLGLFLLRRKEKSTLYFGCFCLIIALRILLVGEIYLIELFPSFNWEIALKMEYLTLYLGAPVFVAFLRSLFPEELSAKFLRASQLLGGLFSVLVLLTPARIYTYSLTAYQIIVLVTIFYGIYVMGLAVARKRDGAVILTAGSLFLGLGIVNDILYYNNFTQAGELSSLGFLIYVFAQSFILSMRFSSAFSTVEELSERLQVMDKLKDDFLTVTSHELRTPLKGITGITGSLLDGAGGKLNELQRHNVSLIDASGKRLAGLVDELLDFARLEDNTVLLQKKPVDLKQTAGFVLTLFAPAVLGKSIELQNNIEDSLPLVDADEGRLQQILCNLVDNAVKFTETGSVAVTALEKDNMVEITVSDTGAGIPPERFGALFKTFRSAAKSDSKEGGRCFGLYISQKLVELHGGRIWAESEVGLGSRFTFTLPVCKQLSTFGEGSIPGAGLEPDLLLTEEQPEADVYRILAADDDPVNQQILVNYLTLNGYVVTPVASGREALELLLSGKQQYDLVILDIIMPKMSGYEVCRKLRERFSLLKLPVLLLTAKSQVENIITGIEVGANDYIAKPFDKNELLARVKTLLLLKKVANLAISSSSHSEAEKQQLLLTENLRDAVIYIASTLDLDEVYHRILECLGQLVPYDRGALYLKQGTSFFVAAARGYEGMPVPAAEYELFTKVIQREEAVVISGGNTVTENGSMLAIPLITHTDTIGIIVLERASTGSYKEYETGITYVFARQAAIALDNAKLFGEVKHLASIDELTGLYNRGNFFKLAEREFKQASLHRQKMSIIMIDIDDFKKINDTYGHVVGDEVLRVAAARCRQCIYEQGIIGRYGGDEFVVLLPDCGDIVEMAERLRQCINKPVIVGEHGHITITASLGVASLGEDVKELDLLLNRADKAMYAAKRTGRDRVLEWV